LHIVTHYLITSYFSKVFSKIFIVSLLGLVNGSLYSNVSNNPAKYIAALIGIGLLSQNNTEFNSYKRSASVEFNTYDRVEGWRKIGDTEYYIDSNGDMLTGWHTLDWSGGRNEFYFNSEGEMLKGWHTLEWSGGRNEFYFDSDGCMVTGWHTLNWSGGRDEFYFEPSGAMVTGWYTLYRNGVMCRCYFDSDGALRNVEPYDDSFD
jgi:hypothetical protein